MFFSIFNDNSTQYLSRSWLIEPDKDAAANKSNGNTWNNEVYCNFGVRENNKGRSWEDARKYGFVAAGGGLWYSRTLKGLKIDERIWVNVPGYGYVGVGIVTSEAMTINQFIESQGLTREQLKGQYCFEEDDGLDNADYVVKVEWLHTEPLEKAISGTFFGNQNSVTRPVAQKWKDTINVLKQKWAAYLET